MSVKAKIGYTEGAISIAINSILFIMKYLVGITYGSVAMMADAWHTLSDTFTSIVVIVGFAFYRKEPDSKHPFGHGRAEGIAAVVIGTLLALAGVNFIVKSLARIRGMTAVTYGPAIYAVLVISIILKEALARYSIRMGNQHGLDSLRADGWHHRTDAISSLIILAGAFFTGRFWWLDSVMGILVSGMILYAAFDILRGATSSLLGEKPEEGFIEEIKGIVYGSCSDVKDIHHIHIHRYGENTELTLHIRLPAGLKLEQAHNISKIIELSLKQGKGIEATVHIEPER